MSRLLNVVRDGQEVTVTGHGKAVARLVPLAAAMAALDADLVLVTGDNELAGGGRSLGVPVALTRRSVCRHLPAGRTR